MSPNTTLAHIIVTLLPVAPLTGWGVWRLTAKAGMPLSRFRDTVLAGTLLYVAVVLAIVVEVVRHIQPAYVLVGLPVGLWFLRMLFAETFKREPSHAGPRE